MVLSWWYVFVPSSGSRRRGEGVGRRRPRRPAGGAEVTMHRDPHTAEVNAPDLNPRTPGQRPRAHDSARPHGSRTVSLPLCGHGSRLCGRHSEVSSAPTRPTPATPPVSSRWTWPGRGSHNPAVSASTHRTTRLRGCQTMLQHNDDRQRRIGTNPATDGDVTTHARFLEGDGA